MLGLISLAQEDYVNAHEWFEQSLAAYHEIGQQDAQSWALAFLGVAALGMNDLNRSRRQLFQALQMGVEADAFLTIVVALSGVTLLLARLDDVDRAVELWALLSRYPLVADALLVSGCSWPADCRCCRAAVARDGCRSERTSLAPRPE